MISNECWVISLDITSKMWFFDFVAAQETDLLLPGIRDGKVSIKNIQSEAMVDSLNELLFQCQTTLMDVRRSERLLYSSWPISRSKADFFYRMSRNNKRTRLNTTLWATLCWQAVPQHPVVTPLAIIASCFLERCFLIKTTLTFSYRQMKSESGFAQQQVVF